MYYNSEIVVIFGGEMVSLISSILKLFSTEISDEDEKIIQKAVEAINEMLNRMATSYVTLEDRENIQSQMATHIGVLRSIYIPRKHPLHNLVHEYEEKYRHLNTVIEDSNQSFMKYECNRCKELLSNIDGKVLDNQQQVAVVCDENRNLVLAGAGSGKTLTIAGKVKYLCQEKHINPEDILLIAFTKKSAGEMTERISKKLSIPVQASTFHKLGLDIITNATGKRPEVVDDLGDFIKEYFEKYIVDNPRDIKNLIEYFAYYLHVPADLDKFDSLGEAYDYEKGMDLETLRSKYDQSRYVKVTSDARKENNRTLKNERVKSMEEVSIANFLFLNGVEYEYERLYPFESDDPTRKAYRPDFYLPDYDIYLEHFGIDRNGKLPWLSPVEEEKYQEDMKWKRAFHQQNGTKLIETYSYYSSDGVLLERLDKLLKENGVKYREPDFLDIFNSVYAKKGEKYFSEFIRLCCTFITLFKSNGYDFNDLYKLNGRSPIFAKRFFRRRTELFKEIVGPILIAYKRHLEENQAVDFSDMIITAAQYVNNGCKLHQYKWIIIDEFQDISVSRYKLVSAILQRTRAKLLCVGDF